LTLSHSNNYKYEEIGFAKNQREFLRIDLIDPILVDIFEPKTASKEQEWGASFVKFELSLISLS